MDLTSKIKELRGRTGAGILECRKLLLNNDCDVEKAIVEMRKAGLAKADAKAHRETKEGLVLAVKNLHRGCVLEVNCETDFVARSDVFNDFVRDVAQSILVEGTQYLQSTEVESKRQQVISEIGENIVIKRAEVLEGENIGCYNHNRRIATVVALNNPHEESLSLDMALHISASSPLYISSLPADIVEQETEIYLDMVKDKPEAFVNRIIEGKLQKLVVETCLLSQPFIKNLNVTVKEVLKDATVEKFVRFQLGA